MVYLSRIYTRTGDDGETGLGDMSRVRKDHPRVCAYGNVDELNAVLGIATTQQTASDIVDLLRSIQNDLFDLGADLCCPEADGEKAGERLRITAEQVIRLEQAIDRYNARLAPLTSFILPGGSPASAWCHLARTVCRSAERSVVTLTLTDKVNPPVVIYLNRLSDLLFVLGRIGNDDGKQDVLWQPGQSQR